MTPSPFPNVPEANPWTRVLRTTAYENPWIRVDHDEVIRPDGKPGIYGVIHYRNRSVGVVAVNERNEVLLVGQYRYTIDSYSWEIPAGGCADEEAPDDCARRELKEETGFSCTSLRPLVSAHMSNSVSDELGHCYLAEGLTAGEARPEGTEQIEMIWLDFPEALRAIQEGKITDALTILGLQQLAVQRMTVS